MTYVISEKLTKHELEHIRQHTTHTHVYFLIKLGEPLKIGSKMNIYNF